MTQTHKLIAAALELAPTIRDSADQIETDGKLPKVLVEQLSHAGFFRMFVPQEYGGDEVDPGIVYDALEQLAMADASTAWVVMVIGCNPLLFGNSLLPDVWAEVYGDNPDMRSAGAIAPSGRAVQVDGGYRVSGHWKYGSGSEHSEYLISGCIVFDGEQPKMIEQGPEIRFVLHRAADCKILTDTWDTTGLRGSGSHDYVIDDLFVPEAWAYSFGSNVHKLSNPMYRFPTVAFFCLPAITLGLARVAIETVSAMAMTKRRGPLLMSEDASVQIRIAEATALQASARGYIKAELSQVMATLNSGEALSVDQRATFRLAVSYGVDAAVRVVDMMYKLGGGNAVYKGNILERIFRDVHTAHTHIQVNDLTYIKAGRMLLGLDPQDPIFNAAPA